MVMTVDDLLNILRKLPLHMEVVINVSDAETDTLKACNVETLSFHRNTDRTQGFRDVYKDHDEWFTKQECLVLSVK